ncbi:MAG: hypothetical protein PHQ98_03890 [Candidatus ainarchaeum sp.]|nr:hypothetical protein [Candidatus ainarchaeum sp.]
MQLKSNQIKKRINPKIIPNIESKQHKKYQQLQAPENITANRLKQLALKLAKRVPSHSGGESNIYFGKKKLVKIFHEYQYYNRSIQSPLNDIFRFFEMGINRSLKSYRAEMLDYYRRLNQYDALVERKRRNSTFDFSPNHAPIKPKLPIHKVVSFRCPKIYAEQDISQNNQKKTAY